MDKSTMTETSRYSFSDKLLSTISSFRERDYMTDVILCVDMKAFPCHRLVLAATSPYFYAMFNSGLRETHQYEIFINDITEETMDTLIVYFYTGSVNIHRDNAVDILHASDLFQIDVLKDVTIEFLMKNLATVNCLQMWNLAKKFYCLKLQDKAMNMIVDKFTVITQSDDFLDLQSDDLATILADDRLNVPSEEIVCNAACDWLNHDHSNRVPHFQKILEHLRLPLVSTDYLIKIFQPKIGRIALNNTALSIMDEAKIYHLFPARQTESDSPRTKSRLHFTYRDSLILIGSNKLPNNVTGVDMKYLDIGSMEILDIESPPNLQTIDFAVCTYGSDVYISGGSKSPTDLLHFHSVDQKWKSRSPMNEGRARHVMAAVGKNIYTFGGYSGGTILDSIEQYSVTFDSWENVGKLNQVVCLSAAEAIGQNILILGGLISEQTTTSFIQSYDTRTNHVTTLTNQLPLRCALHRSMTQNETVYIVNRTGKIVEYVTSAPPRILSHLENFNRGHFGAVFYHGSIYLLENDIDEQNSLNVHKYDLETNKWSHTTLMTNVKLPQISCCVRTLIKYPTNNDKIHT